MPIRMNGKTYYRTADICHEIGISRATLYRWLRTGFIVKAYKDRRGWRLFTEDDFNKLQLKAMEVRTEYTLARK
jgi:predicted site-specific integrase-resolvase